MKSRKVHVLMWILWALALAVYLFKVANFDSRDWRSFLFLLAIHMASCYYTVYVVFRRRMEGKAARYRTVGALLVELIAIFALIVAVSIVGGELTVDVQPGIPRKTRVFNYWEVMFMLYAGVAFGVVFAIQRQHATRQRAAEHAAAELREKLTDSEVMKLSSMMVPHLINNLLGSLAYVSKHRPQYTRTALWLIIGIVNNYARLRPDERIRIGEELAIAKMFLELLEYECGYAPQIDIRVEDEVLDIPIIPMLIMLPLENISKYAVLNHTGRPACIRVSNEKGLLVIYAENDVRNRRKTDAPSTENGLANMESKLRLMGVTFDFEHGMKNGRYVFRLAIQLD